MKLSKIANISITETDAMDLLEQKALVDLLIKELKAEQGEQDIMSQAEVLDEGDNSNKELPR